MNDRHERFAAFFEGFDQRIDARIGSMKNDQIWEQTTGRFLRVSVAEIQKHVTAGIKNAVD